MLTTEQKEQILLKAGVTLSASLPGGPTRQLQQADAEFLVRQTLQTDCSPHAKEHRTRTIDALFDEYTAHRAAMSLRDSDASRQVVAAGWGGPTT